MALKTKKQLVLACHSYVEKRTNRILGAIADLEEALKLETKCSMGDKYETSRAMLHLEFEKLSAQLEQYKRLNKTLTFIKEKQQAEIVEFGSIVKTCRANYFIAIPGGEIKSEDETFFAVGANSPIAQVMMGKKAGETYFFNNAESRILHVE